MCPPGVDLVWTLPPPLKLKASVAFSAAYELRPGRLNLARSGPEGMLIVHANLHACKKELGFCEPSMKPADDGSLNPIVSHEEPKKSDSLDMNSTFALPAGDWTIIAHVRFFTTDGGQWDISRARSSVTVETVAQTTDDDNRCMTVGVLLTMQGHNHIGHDYIGHNYIDHNYKGHNYIGHNYKGHNYIGT